MTDRKKFSSVSTEELLSKVDSPDTIQTTTEYETFLSLFKIAPGNMRVKRSLFSRLYHEWSGKFLPRGAYEIFRSSDSYLYLNKSSLNLFSLYNQTRNEKKSKRQDASIKRLTDFITFHNLKKGDVWVDRYVLFYVYDNWSYNTKRTKPLAANTFCYLITVYFPNKQVNDSYWIGVSAEFRDQYLTQEVLVKATEWARKHHENKRSKKTKKNKKK